MREKWKCVCFEDGTFWIGTQTAVVAKCSDEKVARLITAAPEMYNALCLAIDHLREGDSSSIAYAGKIMMLRDRIDGVIDAQTQDADP